MSLSGLVAGTVFYARVRAIDSYGNASNYGFPRLGATAYENSTLSAADSPPDALRVYPNPWRHDRHQGSPVTFDHLELNSTVKIFTVSGHWVKTLDASSGMAQWNLTTDGGENASSGLYMYLITNGQGMTAKGTFALIR